MEHWEIVDKGQIVVSSSPEMMWAQAKAYFSWCDKNPVLSKKTLQSGKEAGMKVEVESPRPYSIKALCLHLGITEEYLKDIRETKDKDSLYYIVVSRILLVIHVQNLEYAITGVFNPVFTSKVLNTNTLDAEPAGSVKVEIVQGLPPLSSSENELLEKMEAEGRL